MNLSKMAQESFSDMKPFQSIFKTAGGGKKKDKESKS
jgi:hypothetical protein